MFRRHSDRWKSSNYGFSVCRHETRHLPDRHVTRVGGIPVTTVERAVRDFAARATPAELTKVLAQGEKERIISWDELRSIASQSNGQAGIGNLRAEIEGWLPGFVDTGSDPEIDFLLMIRRNNLPVPLVNQKIGPYIIDFLWSHLKLAVELDPYGTHSGRSSHRRDHRKSIELEAMGLRVVRFTDEDLYQHETRTALELAKVQKQQAALLGVPLSPDPEHPRPSDLRRLNGAAGWLV